MKVYNLGDACICFEFSTEISEDISYRVIRAYNRIKEEMSNSIRDVVPAYNSLAIHFNSAIVDSENIKTTATRLIEKSEQSEYSNNEKPSVLISVNYDGMDFDEVCELNNLTREEVIKLHTMPTYLVAMVGFRPNFPYLLGLPANLITPRRATPRKSIPKGSVAIGGEQTGVYPVDGPGGWNIIGNVNCNLGILKTLKAGDRVKFVEMKNV